MGVEDLNDTQGDILVEYFTSLREEIHLRIEKHTRLVWIKLVAIGAATSFLLSEFYGSTPGDTTFLYLLWLLPVGAITFDVLIAGNLEVIYNLGHYNRTHLEQHAFDSIKDELPEEFGFWEESVAQSGGNWVCYTDKDISTIWIMTLGAWAFALFARIQVTGTTLRTVPTVDVLLGIVTFAGTVWAFRQMRRTIHADRTGQIGPVGGSNGTDYEYEDRPPEIRDAAERTSPSSDE